LWQRFLRAEQETEEEIRDVVNEVCGSRRSLLYAHGLTSLFKANAFAENWGSIIFQSANEIVQNELVRKRVGNLQSQVESEKSWWEKRRAAIQDGFMKELDDEKAAKSVKAHTKGSDDEAVLVESGGPAVAHQGQGKKKKKGHN
jgi:translocation protein SEC66